jgi:hypothetical protein
VRHRHEARHTHAASTPRTGCPRAAR